MIIDAFRNFIELTTDYFHNMTMSIADPDHVERERARNLLQAYWHNKDDVDFMVMALNTRELIAQGFFTRNSEALAEFLKCGAAPGEAVDLLDECIGTWATTPTRWEDGVARKCREWVVVRDESPCTIDTP